MEIMDRNSPIPLYYQLKNVLLNKIREGEWAIGELIPSENRLQQDYDLSRTTVRQTLAELVSEGYLIRKRGRGTFIAEPKITYDPSRQYELNEYMSLQGVHLSWRVLDRAYVEVPDQVALGLGIAEASKLLRIRRLRLADNRVFGYHIAYIPKHIEEYINEDALGEGQSLDYLQACPNLFEPRLQRTLEASIANQLDIDWLDAAPNTAILQLERIVYGKDNHPIEFLVARFRGDRFKYQISL
ncbi:GntR family transcriptional regulator [Anaerolineales bacterium]